MKTRLLILALLINAGAMTAQNEVFYHVFQRSFFDSDDDGNGDLKGIRQQLDYLQDLGVTTVLLTPLYLSDFYHNYFAADFEKIDPEYGSMGDYLQLVREIHKRGMKIFQDVEMQYVSGKHLWYTDSYGNPASGYSKYLVYLDESNTKPFWFFNVPEFTTYDNSKQQIIVVNMKEKAVRDYTEKLLQFWMDPNKDGRFDDGVDGFRLDHMMDDLDNAGKLTHLFADFWTPVLTQLRDVNPKVKIVAEQANWGSYGHDYFKEGAVDYVFAFRLKFAINKFDKAEIEKAADSTLLYNPAGKNQLVFLENHDTKRFASENGMTPEKAKAAAAIQLLIGGIPSLYYGQEIGMKGIQQSFGMTDGNDIPVREAFDWYADGEGKGMARWYKNTGPWWDKRTERPHDGISLEEQQDAQGSLWQYYRILLQLRKKHPVLQDGSYRKVSNENASILTFLRYKGNKACLVVVNLSGTPQHWNVTVEKAKAKALLGSQASRSDDGRISGNMAGYGAEVFELQ